MASTLKRLSEDEVAGILSFLPAKAIIKLRTLSRYVLRRSACNHFLLTQSRHTKADSGFFTRPYYGPVVLTLLDPHAGIPNEGLRFLQHAERVVRASANGLVFCSNKSRILGSLCVCNPVAPIATLRFIPPPTGEEHHDLSCIGVAVDRMSRGYELVCFTKPPDWHSPYCFRVYASADNAWKFHKMVDGGPRDLQLEYPVICGRTVYLASTCGPYMHTAPYIVAFDIEEEGSEILSIPREATKASDCHEIRIARWGEKSLCLISCRRSSIFKLWAMSRDQGTIAWVEKYQVSMMEMGLTSPGDVHSFTVINSDTLVFVMNSSIYSYDIKKRALKELQKGYPSGYPILISYANSLRPY
ncbi:uncharacterized protein LOC103716347 [Phoenix dactylifera]|uniref:Uncharacterized protein LOC103716347 n=1 Tax=Phoenix dactylifera TaxID=42345 RepID=A0A8B7CMT1_PHODC|nr:uncharacterized protein LOC103716347 [Phoenix dactylifera]